MRNIFFNAHHSPIGAYSTFTLGYKGAKGGFGLELGKPADQNVYIGLETEDGTYEALPFFQGAVDESKRYDVENVDRLKNSILESFELHGITRDYQLTSDTWKAGDLTFTIYNPVRSIPNLEECCDEEEVKKVILPAVFVEMTIDNTNGSKNKKAFFGYQGNDPYSGMTRIDEYSDLVGIGQGRFVCIATDDKRVKGASGFSIEKILNEKFEENYRFGLGSTSVLLMEVPKGEKHTYKFTVCFFREGIVTTGLDCKYYYTKYFKDLMDVATFSTNHFDELVNRCKEDNLLTQSSKLSTEQQFLMNHSIRSYYGSTELLINEDKPVFVVNEGEYRMMNTFDLTVDQLFYEMKMNPWTVKNELELFISRYQYEDTVRFPSDPKEYPGGISFTHDMGVANCFTRQGHSSYEMVGLEGCFSHMTHEQLVNFICCSVVYGTKYSNWINEHMNVLEACFNSLINRDHPIDSMRDGFMSLDSSRVMGGSEITTYDSLDISLGQSRNNIYLGIKSFASYVCLEQIFKEKALIELAEQAQIQAKRCVSTILKHIKDDAYIPAVLEKNNDSKIIPVVEGLVYIDYTNPGLLQNEYPELLSVLKKHLEYVIQKGICLFEDGGWKLSSTSNNSWLSKIFLNQYIIKKILKMNYDPLSDLVHMNWLLHDQESYWCFSDQIISGVAAASKYYPRGVTSILWLEF